MQRKSETLHERAEVSRARMVSYVGLAIAFMTVCSWVTIPIGTIPFTLQMLGIPLMICVLPPMQAVVAIYGFAALGALGLPLFSGMRGGIGVILGPTGGFIVGYLIAVPLACLLLWFVRSRGLKGMFGWYIAAGLVFTLVAYVFGCIQYTLVAGVDIQTAVLVCAAPFIIPDIIKVVLAAVCAKAVNAALGSN